MLFDREQKILEAAEDMRADRFGLEGADQGNDGGLVGRYREMVRPEMDQPFDEGRRGGERAREAGIGG